MTHGGLSVNLETHGQVGIPGKYDVVPLPQLVNLSSEKLDSSSAFLLENGQVMYLWLGRDLPLQYVQEVFNTNTVDRVDVTKFYLDEYPNDTSRRLHNIIRAIRRRRVSYPKLVVVRKGDPHEQAFMGHITEDKGQGSMSYVEFLCHLHRQIQNKLL
eukprot:TRINITY_DN1592_c0_g1_i1.p2 TRINITY_DN1592_c0_g1~~TRINITY_DN1592_c0_g1_i1.p2  ORF type:complete len:157 (-),score=30.44 TRINITY_DN1592_c0_g1_i1:225-695(-)